VERHEIIELLGQRKLAGMRAAGACPRAARSADPGDEVVAARVRAQHPFQRIFGELLLAQLADHRARSTAYRMGVARFPVMPMWFARSFSPRRASSSACARSSARSRRCGGSWRQKRPGRVRIAGVASFWPPPRAPIVTQFENLTVRPL